MSYHEKRLKMNSDLLNNVNPENYFVLNNGFVIRNLRIHGDGSLGLFGQTGPEANIANLGLEDVDIDGTGECVGALAGSSEGSITMSYSTGSVSGDSAVGGLVGANYGGSIAMSFSTSSVSEVTNPIFSNTERPISDAWRVIRFADVALTCSIMRSRSSDAIPRPRQLGTVYILST